MVTKMSGAIGTMIDAGRTDVQILEALRKEHGPDLLRPHQTLIK
jgi:hypothetical protein